MVAQILVLILIFFFLLNNVLLANVLILWGEFSFWSHMGIKGLKWRTLFAFEV